MFYTFAAIDSIDLAPFVLTVGSPLCAVDLTRCSLLIAWCLTDNLFLYIFKWNILFNLKDQITTLFGIVNLWNCLKFLWLKHIFWLIYTGNTICHSAVMFSIVLLQSFCLLFDSISLLSIQDKEILCSLWLTKSRQGYSSLGKVGKETFWTPLWVFSLWLLINESFLYFSWNKGCALLVF